ncbi:endonuclease/exonuclease/phosphatase family protein [Inhella sp.]|uniref:endonuclease/exonuclease/phosphatase family protein n=1 Tax=Inhella sp. TaxID=1921806 RepID=UPI0035B10DDA
MNKHWLTLLMALATGTALAQPLRVASWNLGWHLDRELAKTWMAACSQPFVLKNERWVPGAGEGARAGWQLPWGRNAPVEWDIGSLPPCDVYQAAGSDGQRAALPVGETLDRERRERMAALLREQLRPDVVAFQEVSGAQAVRELLGADYRVCSYEGHKVQRLAIAWKASLGEGACEVHWPLSLPDRAMRDQVRPGLSLTLRVAGQTLKLLNLHLKSSCVSPLDDQSRTPGRGQLDGEEPNCQHLQAQVAPLEAWLDESLRTSDTLLLLGDFNRNLSHEAVQGGAARNEAGRTRSLWQELNDGDPKPLNLLAARCEGANGALCGLGRERLLARDEYGRLRGELGCRNPIGLDHLVLAGQARSLGVQKQSLQPWGDTTRSQLALSDHCPVVAEIELAKR